MRKLLFIVLVLTGSGACAQFAAKDMKPLHALKGSWESERKRGTLTEQWTLVNDSTLQGYSYIKTATDSFPEEKTELVLRAGKILYIPVAAGQNDDKPVPFTLYKVENGQYFFENRSHDFPQLITYQLVDDNTLKAAISGPLNGKDTAVRFDFKRKRSQ